MRAPAGNAAAHRCCQSPRTRRAGLARSLLADLSALLAATRDLGLEGIVLRRRVLSRAFPEAERDLHALGADPQGDDVIRYRLNYTTWVAFRVNASFTSVFVTFKNARTGRVDFAGNGTGTHSRAAVSRADPAV